MVDYVGDVVLELLFIGYVVSCFFYEFCYFLVVLVIVLECLFWVVVDGLCCCDWCFDVVFVFVFFYYIVVVLVIRGVGVVLVVVFIM